MIALFGHNLSEFRDVHAYVEITLKYFTVHGIREEVVILKNSSRITSK